MPTSRLCCKKSQLIAQVTAAIVFMAFVLGFMTLVSDSQILWAIGAGSLASSTFIVFTIPNSISARPGRVVGGYAVAIVIGIIVHILLENLSLMVSAHFQHLDMRMLWIFSAMAIGLAMIGMILLDCQHPPAAGVAIVLVLDIREYYTLAVILITAIILALIRHFFRDKLINLTE